MEKNQLKIFVALSIALGVILVKHHKDLKAEKEALAVQMEIERQQEKEEREKRININSEWAMECSEEARKMILETNSKYDPDEHYVYYKTCILLSDKMYQLSYTERMLQSCKIGRYIVLKDKLMITETMADEVVKSLCY